MKAVLQVEQLEPRLACYAVTPLYWQSLDVTVSIASEKLDTPTVQRALVSALAKWDEASGVDFTIVPDDRSPLNVLGREQGDPRFGDVRVRSQRLPLNVLAAAYFPPRGGTDQTDLGGTGHGDVLLNSRYFNGKGGRPGFWGRPRYDLETVLLHEIGHAIGIAHSSERGSVMRPTVPRIPRRGLTADDVMAVRVLYGEEDGT